MHLRVTASKKKRREEVNRKGKLTRQQGNLNAIKGLDQLASKYLYHPLFTPNSSISPQSLQPLKSIHYICVILLTTLQIIHYEVHRYCHSFRHDRGCSSREFGK